MSSTGGPIHHETPVLVVGAGPAGLIAALQLATNGQKCMLVERNRTTTSWPKMDITNVRSMELLKRLSVDQGLRNVGVPQQYSFDVLFSTSIAEGGKLLAKWDLPSPDEWRRRIREQNDGSMPREPYQRCSQAIFEAWLKPQIEANPLIETHFGWTFKTLEESPDGVRCSVLDLDGQEHVIDAKYVIGCDGAGSKVRAAIGSQLVGGAVPGASYLVHFKSRDLSKLHRQGQFWHIFFTSGATIISQDENDTWTIHVPVPIGTDAKTLDPKEAIFTGLGGELGRLEIEVDEILVTSVWRPNIFLANKYTSDHGRIFISGDAAHQNIPTGGYGMNTAVGDSFDIGWKVAAVLAGYGGEHLLRSYEPERRPVAARNIERSGVHMGLHQEIQTWSSQAPGVITSQTPEGEALRSKVAAKYEAQDGENKDLGLELGYRYTTSPVVVGEDARDEPTWNFRHYVPSTFPGVRAPHVFLKDGETSIFDLFGTGPEYTLVDFTAGGSYGSVFAAAAAEAHVPLKVVRLPDEAHVRRIWERDAVLVRPDDHVAWRAAEGDGVAADPELAKEVLAVAVGQKQSASSLRLKDATAAEVAYAKPSHLNGEAFTGTTGVQKHEEVQSLAAFQQ
ncbi:hypothetical protein PV08_07634 [Exophiala spinifera]|uniref:FAD-binding domain-containing protein n=1 Tax=Exophiala spinifera TaxID=91928 RepID=A0A0D2BU93_9EURO|nr:uncharacterized protein PV08_07634 [Exophiala spinifera]KIW14849.1 hypothetical protein PV08_07634 [Exophiala spinifera]